MKHCVKALLLSFIFCGLAACATQTSMPEASSPGGSISALTNGAWTTNIRSFSEVRSTLSDTVRQKSSGSAEWVKSDVSGRSVVNLAFSYGGEERALTWAILFGACNSASLPVLPKATFTELEMDTGGRVTVKADIPLELPRSGNYRVEIYRDREGTNDSLVGCGNFKFVKR